MKLHYYPETDSLYIDLNDRPSANSKEVAPGVVADFDAAGALVGFDIDNAAKTMDLRTLETIAMPTQTLKIA